MTLSPSLNAEHTPRTLKSAGHATRLAFFLAGVAIACWAPLVPYAKAQVGADEAELGLLLLCLGAGALVSMPIAGAVTDWIGARALILLGGLGVAASVPILGLATSSGMLAVGLLIFGLCLGAVDIATNVHASDVQTAAGRSLMAGFHGAHSVGMLAGAAGATLVLSSGGSPLLVTLLVAALSLVCTALAAQGLLRARAKPAGGPLFVVPRGIIAVLGCLAAGTFLIEGAMLDWSAVLLNEARQMDASQAGIGFTLHSLAMAASRMVGDGMIRRWGPRRVMVAGAMLCSIGLVTPAIAPNDYLALAGFLLVGAGVGNIAPVLISAAANQSIMPAGAAIAAVSSLGYAGLLAGPALIGFIAHGTSLVTAFILLAVLMAVIAAGARLVPLARG